MIAHFRFSKNIDFIECFQFVCAMRACAVGIITLKMVFDGCRNSKHPIPCFCAKTKIHQYIVMTPEFHVVVSRM